MSERKSRTQSQQIRNLIFRIWENTRTRIGDEEFYEMRTNKIITDLQKELRNLTEPPLPEEPK